MLQPPPLNTPLTDQRGQLTPLWSRFFISATSAIDPGSAPSDARYFVGRSNGSLSAEVDLSALSSGYLKITSSLGVATPSTTATLPASDLSGALPAISGAALTNLSASALASGTVPDARFPATLPALNGSALTALTAANLVAAVTVVTFGMSPYTVLSSDSVLLVNATGGNVALTLPTATSGRILTVKKTDASANTCTLTGTVDGVVDPVLTVQYQSRMIVADGSAWFVVGQV